jgi:hypothetical protein
MGCLPTPSVSGTVGPRPGLRRINIELLPRIWNRVHSDFLLGSRLDEYRHFLESALRAGYRIVSVGGAWRLIREGGLDPERRYLVLRLDVDTDPRTAAAMWQVAQGLGIEGSYFFRLSTLDPSIMAAIAAGGSEASYHYEELATVAKRRRLRKVPDALAALPEARDLFAANLVRLRAATGLPMRVVAAHGDFVNRRLGIPNSRLVEQPELRQELGIDLETYDEAFLRHLTSRHIDAPPPHQWEPSDPSDAIAASVPVVSVLVHPRQWRASPVVNARDDARRVVEGVRYRLPTRPGGHA